MTIPWPTELPQPQREGYAFTPSGGVLRSDGDTKISQRRRHDHARNTTELKFVFTENQFLRFVGYWYFELRQGIIWIQNMQMHDGTTYVRFIDAYSAEYIKDYWRITATVEWDL